MAYHSICFVFSDAAQPRRRLSLTETRSTESVALWEVKIKSSGSPLRPAWCRTFGACTRANASVSRRTRARPPFKGSLSYAALEIVADRRSYHEPVRERGEPPVAVANADTRVYRYQGPSEFRFGTPLMSVPWSRHFSKVGEEARTTIAPDKSTTSFWGGSKKVGRVHWQRNATRLLLFGDLLELDPANSRPRVDPALVSRVIELECTTPYSYHPFMTSA